MPQEKKLKAVQIPDGVPLPTSPEELAQALFKSADRKLEMEGEPWASSGPGREKRKAKD